jgi:branched-chain amino acid transport system substrate-binding protein
MNLRSLVVAALAGVSILVVSACGASPSSGSADSGPIPIGVIGSYTGAFSSSVGTAKDAIDAWAKSVNDAGGINGRKIELFVEDDQTNVANGLSRVKRLVEQDKVVAIVGEASSNAAPWADYVKNKGIPVVGGNAVEPAFVSNADFFSVAGNLVSNFYGVTELAKGNGPNLGHLYCAELPVCNSTSEIIESVGGTLGTKLAYSAGVTSDSSDFTAQCQALKNAGVQSYSIALAATLLQRVAAQCEQQGLAAKLVLTNVADSNSTKVPALEGIEVADTTFPFWDRSTPARKAMHDALARYAPQVGTDRFPMNSFMANAWASGKLFEAAVRASGSQEITPDSIKRGLYALNGETLDGLSVPLTFAEGRPSMHNCYFSYTIREGRFESLNGGQAKCAPDAVIAEAATTVTH